MSQSIWTVTALVRYIKKYLEAESSIQSVAVQGEISNFTAHRSGHWYFTLKDNSSRCSCVMFAQAAAKVSVLPKDGDQVIIIGSVSVFEASGQMQLYVSRMIPQGLGALYAKLEELKKKLTASGIFDDDRKKPIPMYPSSIAIITSKNTAAYQDVTSTLRRRWPMAKVTHFHSAVQGEGSLEQLIDALKEAQAVDPDVILMVRGGGSIEDLWTFNEEALVLAMNQCKVPIITGVGHQSDVTLADFVADLRAPTPTGAAEMATPDQQDVLNQLSLFQRMFTGKINKILNERKTRLNQLKSHRYLLDPYRLSNEYQLSLTYLTQKLDKQQLRVIRVRNQVSELQSLLARHSKDSVYHHQSELNQFFTQLKHHLTYHLKSNDDKIKLRKQLLESLSPIAILNRGYAITYQNAKLVTSISQLSVGQPLTVRYADGIAETTITQIKESENGKTNL